MKYNVFTNGKSNTALTFRTSNRVTDLVHEILHNEVHVKTPIS